MNLITLCIFDNYVNFLFISKRADIKQSSDDLVTVIYKQKYNQKGTM